MQELKLILSGVAVMDNFRQLCSVAKEVHFGSYNIGLDTFWGQLLPNTTTAVIGVPREEPGKTNCLRVIGALQARWGRLQVRYREDFHAKYYLFRMARSTWVLLGSANLTSSPMIETAILARDEHLFNSLLKRHQKWFASGKAVEPYKSVKMEKSALAALSSRVVGEL